MPSTLLLSLDDPGRRSFPDRQDFRARSKAKLIDGLRRHLGGQRLPGVQAHANAAAEARDRDDPRRHAVSRRACSAEPSGSIRISHGWTLTETAPGPAWIGREHRRAALEDDRRAGFARRFRRAPRHHRAHEIRDERRPGTCGKVSSAPALNDAPIRDHSDLVRERRRLLVVVGDEHRRVRPLNESSPANSRAAWPRVDASSALSGSSRSRAGARRASARASATRWRSPPESVRGRASARAATPKRSSSSMRLRAARRPSSRRARRRRSATRSGAGRARSPERGSRSAAPRARRTCPPSESDQTSPRAGDAPRVRALARPAMQRRSEVLPAPDGPTRARQVAGATSSESSSSKSPRRCSTPSTDNKAVSPPPRRQLHRRQAAPPRTRPAPPTARAPRSGPSRSGSTIASGAVWVTPWNDPAKISVAPNSPSALPHASAPPVTRPGIATGTATRANVRASEAPSVRDASSQRGSSASNDAWAWRT